MKKPRFSGRLFSALIVVLLFFFNAPASNAQVSASLGHAAPYMWRGEKLSSGFVLQPSLDVGFSGFNINFFGNLDPNGGALGNAFHFNEADLAFSYSLGFKKMALSGGYIIYTFPTPSNGVILLNPTEEMFLQLETEIPLSPSLFLSYDFDGDKAAGDIKGIYAEFAISESYELGDFEIVYSNAFGIDAGYVQPQGDVGISHFFTTVSASKTINGFTLSPLLGFQVSMSDTYKELFGKTIFFGGLGFSI